MPDSTPDTTRPASPRRQSSNEEPEIAFEESIPSDGDDPVGAKMIDELGQTRPDKPEQAPEDPPPEPMPEQLPVS
jgi:hypothetical protein